VCTIADKSQSSLRAVVCKNAAPRRREDDETAQQKHVKEAQENSIEWFEKS
jgi:hypothetical protein